MAQMKTIGDLKILLPEKQAPMKTIGDLKILVPEK
ncbi:cell wall-active antibiotics response protein [Mesobacillus jeotgali]|nr:cell wall-active antibiotics response protein [Mesobacillus jeotgali]